MLDPYLLHLKTLVACVIFLQFSVEIICKSRTVRPNERSSDGNVFFFGIQTKTHSECKTFIIIMNEIYFFEYLFNKTLISQYLWDC